MFSKLLVASFILLGAQFANASCANPSDQEKAAVTYPAANDNWNWEHSLDGGSKWFWDHSLDAGSKWFWDHSLDKGSQWYWDHSLDAGSKWACEHAY